jgi:hypothetical protein
MDQQTAGSTTVSGSGVAVVISVRWTLAMVSSFG